MEGVKFERKIEILEHKVAVLEALCKDMRFTIEVQDRRKEEERAKRNELARKTKTVESQATEVCEERTRCEDYKLPANHCWVVKSKVGSGGLAWWKECCFCEEQKLDSGFCAMYFARDIPRRLINFMSRVIFLTLTSRKVPKCLLTQKMCRVPKIFASQRLLYI